MKTQPLNARVALAVGWTHGRHWLDVWDKPEGWTYGGQKRAGPPDLTLDFMHAAEKVLTDDQLLFEKTSYQASLLLICSGRESDNDCGYNDFQAWAPVQATAEQRGRALLRTLGLPFHA